MSVYPEKAAGIEETSVLRRFYDRRHGMSVYKKAFGEEEKERAVEMKKTCSGIVAALSAAVVFMAISSCAFSTGTMSEDIGSSAATAAAAEEEGTSQSAAAEQADTRQLPAAVQAGSAQTAVPAEEKDNPTEETGVLAAEESADAESSDPGLAAEESADAESAGMGSADEGAVDVNDPRVVLGDEQFETYLPLLAGKRVAVFSNQTGIVGDRILQEDGAGTEGHAGRTEASNGGAGDGNMPFGQTQDGSQVRYGEHILNALVARGVDVTVGFSPEHGFTGTADAGAQVDDSVEEETGVPVRSLYGAAGDLSAADLDRFDTLVIDIQDVGLRYYTYYITMYHLMEACAEAGKEVVLLDRPNPNGFYVDGPILQEGFASGVGALPLPVVHGLTLGELALMINGEGWLPAGKDACRLTVIPCKNYTHGTRISLIIKPSPNLKDMRAVYLYASTCFFENTVVSVGRGTEYPFTIYGSPYFADFAGEGEYDYTFVPTSIPGAVSPPFEGQTCYGKTLREKPLEQILQEQIHLEYLLEAYRDFHDAFPERSFFGNPDGAGHYWIDYLCGTDEVRRRIEEGETAEEIRASWQSDLAAFRAQREPYLLYADGKEDRFYTR